jgi:hypothetical protein
MTATPLTMQLRETQLAAELSRLAALHLRLSNRVRENGIPEAEFLVSYFTATGGQAHAIRRMRSLVQREAHRARGRWSTP